MIISIDLDGTGWDENWSEIGKFKKNFTRVMHRLWNEGHILIINSLRDKGTPEYDNAVDHLYTKNICYHLFNENLPGLLSKYGEARKISAQVHIDDRDLGWVNSIAGVIPDDWEHIYSLLQRHPAYTDDVKVNKTQHHLLKGKLMRTGIDIIGQERRAQVAKHERSLEYDARVNNGGQLAEAAAVIIHAERLNEDGILLTCPKGWDLAHWGKMCSYPKERRIAIAGAWLCAELDRLQTL